MGTGNAFGLRCGEAELRPLMISGCAVKRPQTAAMPTSSSGTAHLLAATLIRLLDHLDERFSRAL